MRIRTMAGLTVLTALFVASAAPVAAARDVRVATGPHLVVDGVDAFVHATLTDFIGSVDPGGAEASAGALRAGQSKITYLRSLTTSDAWLEAIVQRLYVDTLGRPGDAGGVSFWVEQLATGRRTVAQVAASFYASAEYFAGIGGGTNESWVADLYAKVLRRTPEAGGVEYWSGEVVRAGRTSVAFRFFQSPESARTRVVGLYQRLLARTPSSGDVSYWGPQVVARGDLALAESLAASPEYQARAETRFLRGLRFGFEGLAEPVALVEGDLDGFDAAVAGNANPGASVSLVPGAGGAGQAVSFPAPCPNTDATCPRVVLTVPHADDLDPGAADFHLGARVRVAAAELIADHGSNVAQKGLSTTGQYKLQIDDAVNGRPSCVARSAAAPASPVRVTSTVGVADGQWHHVACVRQGDVLRVMVDGTVTAIADLPAGMVIEAPGEPFTVGANGPFLRNDQFHGDLDDVRFVAAA